MASPNPNDVAFNVSRNTAGNFQNSFKRAGDENLIEKILADSVNSGDPAVLQNNISQILSRVAPERQEMAIKVLQSSYANVKEKQKLARQRQDEISAGFEPGIHPTLQKTKFDQQAKNKRLAEFGATDANPGIGKGPTQGEDDINPTPEANAEVKPNLQNQTGSKFKRMNESQLMMAAGFSDKEISEPAKLELKARQEQTKEQGKEKRASRKEIIDFHNESQKYDETLRDQSKIAKSQIQSLDNIEKAISSKNVKPNSLANIFKGFGKIGDKISQALLNGDQSTILSEIPNLLHGWKEVFGVRLSDADLALLEDKLPSIGKNEEANKAVLKIMRKYADMTLLRNKIGQQIKSENNNLRPLGYADEIEKRFDTMVAPVRIINPNNGREIEIPAYKVGDAILAGARIVNHQENEGQ